MPSKSLTIEQLMAWLSETVPNITSSTAALTDHQLHTAPGTSEWCANDVLAHLRACADVWDKYIRRIIAEDMPTIRAVSPRTWINSTNYRELDFQQSLRAFATQRATLLAFLASLPPEDWSRAAIVTGVGAPVKRTVFNYVERLARHERSHIGQIENIGKTMRTEQQP